MAFKVGDLVMKPSLGICRIRARVTMPVEGKQQEFYVIHSGDVKVMVPVDLANKGGLRQLMSERALKQIESQLQEPYRPATDQHGDIADGAYEIDRFEWAEKIKERDPATLCEIVRLLFNKMKDYQQLESKEEEKLLSEAMSLLSEEMAYLNKTTKGRMTTKIKEMLTEARKKRKKI